MNTDKGSKFETGSTPDRKKRLENSISQIYRLLPPELQSHRLPDRALGGALVGGTVGAILGAMLGMGFGILIGVHEGTGMEILGAILESIFQGTIGVIFIGLMGAAVGAIIGMIFGPFKKNS